MRNMRLLFTAIFTAFHNQTLICKGNDMPRLNIPNYRREHSLHIHKLNSTGAKNDFLPSNILRHPCLVGSEQKRS